MQQELKQAYITWISQLATFQIFYTLLYDPSYFSEPELNLIFTTRQLPERMTRDVKRSLSLHSLKGVKIYGFAVCELQKSGVPHWHIIFGSPCLTFITDYHKHRNSIKSHWSKITGGNWSHYDQLRQDEKGQFDVLGYCVKYIEKNDAIFSFPFLFMNGKELPFKIFDYALKNNQQRKISLD